MPLLKMPYARGCGWLRFKGDAGKREGAGQRSGVAGRSRFTATSSAPKSEKFFENVLIRG